MSRRAFRFRAAFRLGLLVALALTVATFAVRADDLIYFAVNIERTPKQPWPGYGVYLGDGYVLTAAHVVGHAYETHPQVVVGKLHLPGEAIEEGAFETNDLTLLRVDVSKLPSSMGLRRLRICTRPIVPGERVDVIIPGASASTQVVSPSALPADVRGRFATAIADVAKTGNSGSGVFDPVRGCLLGIVSRKISRVSSRLEGGRNVSSTEDIAKYFVPPSVMLDFLPPEAKF
jgi:hypothetical protein